MSYVIARIQCLLTGHEWNLATSPFGQYAQCRHCQAAETTDILAADRTLGQEAH